MVLVNVDFLEIYSIVKCFVAHNLKFKVIIAEKNELFSKWIYDNCLAIRKRMRKSSISVLTT